MEYPNDRRGPAPWIWILVVLGALVLVLVVWWAVAAQNEPDTIVVPGGSQTTTPPTYQQPTQQPLEQAPPQSQQPQSSQPVVVQRERPVNIYIERDTQSPRVVTVPRGQEPPQAEQRVRQLNVPDQFRLEGKLWQPSGEAVTSDTTKLKDSGMSVGGNVIYAQQGATQPFGELYLETEPGSGVFVVYTPQ